MAQCPLAEVNAEENAQEVAAQWDSNKLSVRFLVDKLVSRLYNKTKLSCTMTQPAVIIQCLFQGICAEVEGAELRITPETLKDLDEAVFKDLVKVWGCAMYVLISINLEEPVIEKFMTDCFYRHLIEKKLSAISRFFSSLGKALQWSTVFLHI